MARHIRVVLAKVNVALSIFAYTPDAIRSGLVQAFGGASFVQDKRGGSVYLWTFNGVRRIPDPQHPDDLTRGAVFGKILAIADRTDVPVWDPTQGESLQQISNIIMESFFFYYDAWSEILVVEEKPRISLRRVLSNVEALLLQNGNLGRVEIEPYPRAGDLIRRIKALGRITKVQFWLRIPNPNASPFFERLFNALKEMNATNSSVSFAGPELHFDGTLIEEGVHAVYRGYGRCRVYGGGKGEIVDSASLVTKEIISVEDEDSVVQEMSKLVDKKIQEISQGDYRQKGNGIHDKA